MADKISVDNIARGGTISRTEIGQDTRGASYISRKIGKDLVVLKSAHDRWQELKQRVRNELKIREISTGWFGRKKEQGLQLSVNIAHGSRRGVPRLRRVMQHYLDKYSDSLRTLRELERRPDGGNQKSKKALTDVGYFYGRKLEHLKQFDATAKGMFSKAYKASENLRGLSKKALGNVNPNLRDDMLLAQENKLLSVNSWRRKDESCGLVANRQSRRLIRQIVVSALLHHGYAAAKTLKQELTKACELAERSGTSSDLSRYVQGRMSEVMENINDGTLAADAVLDDIVLRNVAALAKANMTEHVAGICSNVGRRDRRRFIEKALFHVAAKGGLNAAYKFLARLKGETASNQLDLARNVIDGLKNASPKEPHYMYMPFNPESGGTDYAIKVGLRKYREKPHFFIIDRGRPGGLPERPLDGIDPHHIVLIGGHGAYGDDELSAIASEEALDDMRPEIRKEAALNAERLAERLEQDGLAKNHKVIRLLSCHAGGDTLRYDRDDKGGPGSLRPNLYDDAFARRLAVALKQRGYRNIVVGGYPGEVGHTGFKKRKDVTAHYDGSDKYILASGLCRYFDGDGKVVPNPRNPEKATKSPAETKRVVEERIVGGDPDYDKPEFGFPVRKKRQI